MKFETTKKEDESIRNWIETHEKEKHKGKGPYAGAIGGAYSFNFTGTGLGNIVVVKCMCGEEFNATDFDEWM